jgi:hypothetical protein
MKKWGLGIEHEMRIRFQKNTSDLDKNIIDNLFGNLGNNLENINNKYIFADSNLLYYYFRLHEVILMKNFKDFIKIDEEKKYYESISVKLELYELAKNKKEFPYNNKKFFNIEDLANFDINKSLEYLDFYIMIYSLYNSPLLFFSYNINNYSIIRDYKNYIKNNILDIYQNNKNNLLSKVDDYLKKIYNNSYEFELYKLLKDIHKTDIVLTITYNNESNIPIINVNKSFNSNSIIKNTINKNKLEESIKIIDNYCNKIRNIFKEDISIKTYKFYKNLYILYKNKIPEIDYSSKTVALEFKTIEYENLNYEYALSSLIDLEKTFFYVINNISIFKEYIDIFGDLVYHNIGSLGKTIVILDIVNFRYQVLSDDYSGSYHIWCTAPYSEKMSMKKFLNIHSTLANKLQLLEPILACHYSSPSYNAFKNSKNESKSSLRQFLNAYSNYGTSDVSLMNGAKKHFINKYYISENDILKNKYIVPIKNNGENIYDINNNLIYNYNKLDTRIVTNNIFSLFEKGDNESKSNIKINNYFNLLFEKTNIRSKTYYLELGADIRTRDLDSFFYPLDEDWERCLLMKNKKLVEIYRNKITNELSYERIFNEEKFKQKLSSERVGFEFRIFDHFPTIYLNQILAIMVPIVIDSVKNPKIITFSKSYVSKQFWHDEMCNVIMNGYSYIIGDEYRKNLEKELSIKFELRENFTTEIVLKELYEKLCDKYKRTHKKSIFHKMAFRSDIKFINFNKKAWKEIIKYFFQNNPNILRKVIYLNKNITNDNLYEILGREHNYNLNKIKNYIKNISDSNKNE